MDIVSGKPIDYIPWDKVEYFSVKLEKPYKGGGLRFRLGTTSAKKNLTFDARLPRRGKNLPYIPGSPIMYPDEAPAIVDTESDTFFMRASMASQVMYEDEDRRRTVPGPDIENQAGFIAFGYFMATMTEDDEGYDGNTFASERERVAARWGGYKMPKNTGQHRFGSAPMNRIGPPDIPHVAITLLDKRMQPLKVSGSAVVIRPREFYDFDNPTHYDSDPSLQSEQEVRSLVEGLSSEEVAALKQMLKGKVHGKTAQPTA